MPSTVQDIVDKAREFIALDVDAAALRWEDPEAIVWVDEAQKQLLRFRPDAIDVDEVTFKRLDELTALTDTLETEERFDAPLANYVIHRLFSKDDQDNENRLRSQLYFRRFRELL